MRITYRHQNNKDYWTKRWTDIPVDEAMENDQVYPLKHAKLTVTGKDGKILEAGCGVGRILRYYHQNGYDIVGMDFIPEAIDKLKEIDSSLQVEVGDVTNLNFEDETFQYFLAFGLYHNLPMDKIKEGIKETYRVVKKGGRVCASFRADNIQTYITDKHTARKAKKSGKASTGKEFHKMNLTRSEFSKLFREVGFEVEDILYVENMPILYKFRMFRAKKHKVFDENLGRKEGYQLSFLGNLIQKSLITLFPSQFCNINILIAQKK